MLRKKTVMMTIAGMLLMAGTALADGTPDAGVPTEHGSGQGGESHDDMGHEADTRGSYTQATSSAGSEPVSKETSAAESHSHGSEADLVETSANLRVLGSFAALNGAFLIIGAWNKFGPKPERTEGQQHE
jgi:hypothetical protein